MKKPIRKAAFAVALALGCVGAEAAVLTYDFSTEFSGATAPSGTPPYATLTFTDVIGGVQMTLALTSTTPTWNADGLYINYAGTGSGLAALNFAYGAGDAASSVNVGLDAYKADGGGYFDIRFNYPQGAGNFVAGESSSYLISGAGVTTADFNALSSPSGGHGTWYAAIHAQNTNSSGSSGWLGAGGGTPVSEPGSLATLLAGLGLLGLGLASRRRSRPRG